MPDPDRSVSRICLFGGTFDPIHCAHLTIAREAQARFGLDRVLFIPAALPPHKANMTSTPYEQRLQMVQLACEPYPSFEPSRLEEGSAFSYTVDTVRKFRTTIETNDELFFLIGADAFDELETWKDWRGLITLVRFVVVTRPGGKYKVPPGACVERLEGLELAVSSSAIRARLAEGLATPELPPAVRSFIETHGLYHYRQQTILQR